MFVLSLIVTVPLQAQLYAGKWVGSLQTPNTQPTGAHFIVGEDSDGWSLVPILGGLPPVAVTNLITTDSTLSFEWTPRSSVLTCNLHKIVEQGFEGTCRTPEASFHIRMLPPGTILNGLSRHAANHSDYTWVRDSTAHFQFYFSHQSYPWFHRDTLLANA